MIHTTQECQIGDNVELMRKMPADSIDTIVTSPPYWGLRDYGVDGQIGLEPTLEEYHARMLEVTAECMRVLKPTGVLFWNHGDSYFGDSPVRKSAAEQFDPDEQYVTKRSEGGLRRSAKREGGLRPKCMTMQNERLIIRMIDDQGWILRNRIIWCLSPSTMLYVKSQKGIMPMTIHDMVRLNPDTIQLWNGNKWTQVLGWSQTPLVNEPIEIILRSGERIRCTPEHKFPTNRGMISSSELQIGDIIETVALPHPEHPDTPSQLPDESIGWFVGMYMAEGSLGDSGTSIQISSHIKETDRYNTLKRIADGYGGTCSMYNTGGNSATINMYGDVLIAIIKKYIHGNSACNKHLRVSCWNRNNEFLEGILRGYLEGDGHYDAKNRRWRLGFTRNYAFESDLRTLSARLGISIRINRSIAKIGDKEYPSFRGEIRFDRSSHGNTKHDAEIVEINRARSGKFWSIGVADEPHVFALASGILTSNSKPNGMPSSVTDRFSNKYEPVYMLVKSNDTNYYYNTKTGHMQQDKPPGTKGREGIDWDWKEVGADYSKSDTKIRAEDAEKLGSPRARVHRETTIKKVSYWVGRDYWFDLDAVRVPFKDASEVQYRKKLRANKEYDVKEPYKTNTPYKHNVARITSQESPNRMWGDAESLKRQIAAGKNPGDVWTIPTQPYPESHFATFPTALIEPMIKAACPAEICPVCGMARERIVEIDRTNMSKTHKETDKYAQIQDVKSSTLRADINRNTIGWTSCDCNAGWIAGTVLDPFAGSGTVGEVARNLNRNAILLELNPEYGELIAKRTMAHTPPLTTYFGGD